ncbi:HD-GYP domain-containing protein [Tepidibacter hydrothermalis]|uniref:HD domain-containing phosphohydrolase n=1 Tax=Tepidibacter hydrothermalis TaxID=3036126 RepID=A0ABY8EHF1_9FIRM|nr:HD domain-containing phosphohydrolase [Tepidibacter hydrothermalis]WFD10932.1 HD domain-containing phosphohydrolase [Tepidibacter hydrothermalis]
MDNYIKKQIKDLVPGDIILHPVYRMDGLMLIDSYKILSLDLIRKIKKHDADDISVLVSPSSDQFKIFIDNKEFRENEFINDLRDIISQYNKNLVFPTHLDSLLNESTTRIANNNLKLFYNKSLFTSFETKLESTKLQKRAKFIKLKLLNKIVNDDSLKELIQGLKEYKDILFLHSINTASMALMIGLTLELSDDELIDLGLAALFSDVGYTEIEKDVFEKYLKNPQSEVKVLIRQIEVFMKVSLNIPLLRKNSIIYGVLDRHEYYNGNGLPKGKEGKNISLLGRILSICQAYDVMVGGYLYNDGMLPSEAIQILWKNKGKQFDPDILSIFIHRSNFFKIGEKIVINNELKGEIVGFTNYIEAPHLPIIKTDSGTIIDLL